MASVKLRYFEVSDINNHGYEILDDILRNIQDLICAANKCMSLYGKQFVVTSGLRSEEDQERINPKAMHSKHLTGQAVDVEDKDGALAAWISKHLDKMEQYGLWFEDFGHTHGWVHMQCCPPKSGRRVFIP